MTVPQRNIFSFQDPYSYFEFDCIKDHHDFFLKHMKCSTKDATIEEKQSLVANMLKSLKRNQKAKGSVTVHQRGVTDCEKLQS